MRKICKKILCLTLFFLFSFSLAGCSDADVVNTIKKIAGTEEKAASKDIKSPAWNTQITVSSSWKTDKVLNEKADIQAYDAVNEKYAIVVSFSLQDFSNSATVDDLANVAKKNIAIAYNNPTFSGMTDITINGLPAKSFEFNAEVEKINAKFLITVVKGQRGVYEIMTWSLATKYDQNKEDLMKVIKSFKEL